MLDRKKIAFITVAVLSLISTLLIYLFEIKDNRPPVFSNIGNKLVNAGSLTTSEDITMAEYLVAEVELESNFDSAINKGFAILADYIFGNNVPRAHIKMTAPVTEQKVSSEIIDMTSPVAVTEVSTGKKYRVTFSMPAKYSLETLPQPNNKEINIRKVNKHKVAALRFSGNLNRKLADIEAKEFSRLLKKKI